MSSATSKYEMSGAIGSSLILVPVVGILAGLVCGSAYAYVTVYSPIGGWISIIFVVGYAFAVGLATAMAIKASKCRNTTLAGILALFVGLFALYSAWIFFLFVLLRQGGVPIQWSDVPTMFFSAEANWDAVLAINNNGWFEMAGGTPSGIFLWVLWLIEAAIIVGMITSFGFGAVAQEVFCERCHCWIEDGPTLHLAAPERMETLQRLGSGHLEDLYQLDLVAFDEYPRMQVETKNCQECQNTATCRIKAVSLEIDKDGKSSEKLNRFDTASPHLPRRI